jgi:Spherulation-specific family 4
MVIAIGLMAFVAPAVSSTNALGFLVPAYFYPSGAGNGLWEALNGTATRVPLIAILNPSSGPGSSADNNYRRVIPALRSAGGRVIGYIHTSYTARPLDDVKGDVDRYLLFYTVDGFFVDEMDNRNLAASYAYYADLYQFIKSKSAAYVVFGNPGTTTQEEYLARPCADTLVTYEHNTGYASYVPDRWVTNYPAHRFAHLPYAVSSAVTMTNYIHLARTRNAGFIFVTDDVLPNPWDTLPAYWGSEVSLLQELNRPQLAIALENQNAIHVEVCGAPGLRSVLETSTNLTQWTAFSTNQPANGKYAITNANPDGFRFYRVKQ